MWKKNKSKLDNWLKELEVEADEVQNDINALSKSVVEKETSEFSSLPTGAGQTQPSLSITSPDNHTLLETQPTATLGRLEVLLREYLTHSCSRIFGARS